MRKFKRGLDPGFEEIVKTFLNTSVGQKIKNSPGLQFCIRDNYISVYFHGCSLLKFFPDLKKGNHKYEIHKKYIDSNFKGNKDSYQKLIPLDGDLIWNKRESYIKQILSTPRIPSLRTYIGKKDEKYYISSYLENERPFLIDFEVAFVRKNIKGKDVADRVDMAIVSENMELQLMEVKMDWNSALKSKKNGDQPIINQMKRYQGFIDSEKEGILNSYKHIAQNYLNLGLLNKFPSIGKMGQKEVLEEFLKRGTIAPSPYLLVISRDDKKTLLKEGRYGNHWERFCKGISMKGSFHDKPYCRKNYLWILNTSQILSPQPLQELFYLKKMIYPYK